MRASKEWRRERGDENKQGVKEGGRWGMVVR